MLLSTGPIYAMLTHPGRVRQGNEDACAASPQDGIFVVCDGMGGAAAGEVASHLAVETLLVHLTTTTTSKPQARLQAAIQAANQTIFEKSRQSPQLSGMGTTLVALLHTPTAGDPRPSSASDSAIVIHPVPPTLWIAHVGDSRCYRRRGFDLTQLTADHSLVAEQVRAGHITAAEAAFSPMRNLITRAVGSHPQLDPEIQGLRPKPGDLYLLASDGLTRELTASEISVLLDAIPTPYTEHGLKDACEALIEAANQNGGHDNITVLLAAFPKS